MTVRISGRASGEPHSGPGRRARLVRGYVLAGGRSTRFGEDKALVELAGKSVLARMLEVLEQSGVPGSIIVGREIRYRHLGARCIEDGWPGEGPLGGIVTALRCSLAEPYGSRWNLIVSCDMPFLTREWLAYLCGRAARSDRDVVVPQSTNGLEPLCACWRTVAADRLQTAFEEGVRKVTDGMKRLRMEVLDEKAWKRFDDGGRLFWNMNTAAEYEEAKRVLEAERG